MLLSTPATIKANRAMMPRAEKKGVDFLAGPGHLLCTAMPTAKGMMTRINIVWITVLTGISTSGMFAQYRASSNGVKMMESTVENEVSEMDRARSPLA